MSQHKQLSGVSPHSCRELLGHAEDKEGKEVDKCPFFFLLKITASALVVFILPSPLKINRPSILSVNTQSLKICLNLN